MVPEIGVRIKAEADAVFGVLIAFQAGVTASAPGMTLFSFAAPDSDSPVSAAEHLRLAGFRHVRDWAGSRSQKRISGVHPRRVRRWILAGQAIIRVRLDNRSCYCSLFADGTLRVRYGYVQPCSMAEPGLRKRQNVAIRNRHTA